MKKKILSIVLILLLLSNYTFVIAANLQYAGISDDVLSGTAILNAAKVVTSDTYLDDDYNANSVPVSDSSIKVYNYGSSTEQQLVKKASSLDEVENYETGKYYTYDQSGKTRYVIKIPANGADTVNNIAKIEYQGALEYKGEYYDVILDISSVRRNRTERDLFVGADIGGSTNPTVFANGLGYNDKVEMDVQYSIRKSSGGSASVSGIWGIGDLDNREGLLVGGFNVNNSSDPNVYLKDGTQGAANLGEVEYKSFGSTGTFFYSTSDENFKDADSARVYLRMKDISSLNLVKTWNANDAAVAFVFFDGELNRYHYIDIETVNGTFSASPSDNLTGSNTKGTIHKIKNGSTYSINYQPSTGCELDYITVDGKKLTSTQLNEHTSSYTFSDINDDHSIKIVYKQTSTPTPTPTTASYKVEHYRQNTNGQYPTTPTDTETKTDTIGKTVTATAKTTGDYSGYVIDETQANVKSGAVKEDGSLVLKLYYKKEKTTASYKVEHYKQNANGQYPTTPTNTENKTDTIGKTVTATPKQYAGYEVDESASNVKTGTVKEDDSLVLKLYYKPIIYKINYVLNGGTNDPTNPATYTVDKTEIFKDPTKSGNTFLGWYEDASFTKPITSTAGKTGDITVYAKWEATSPTLGTYKVQHFIKGANGQYPTTPNDTDTKADTVGKTVTATAKTTGNYAGLQIDESASNVKSGVIKQDNSLVLKLYYTPIIYKINYVLNGGTNDPSNPSTYTPSKTETFKDPTRSGYTFKGWYEDDTFTKPITSTEGKTGDITVYAKWEVIPPTSASYKVQHYIKGANGQYPTTPNDTETKTDTIGKTVTATAKTTGDYAGYQVDESASNVKSGVIKQDNSLVLKLYYTPIIYKINYVLNGGTNDPTNPATYTVNKTETFKDPSREGYVFLGWYEDDTFTKSITSTAGKTGDITVYAKWEPASGVAYKTEYYLKNGDEYELATTIPGAGVTGEKVVPEIKEFTGYEYNEEKSDKEGIVKADGSLVLKVYYDPAEYKIEYILNGGENDPDNPSKYTVDDPVTFKDATRDDYVFKGWYEDPECTKEITSTVGKTGDLKVYAKWEKIDTTAPTPIPQTGDFNPIVVFSSIAAITLLGVFGIRYFNLKKYMK